MDLLYLRKLWAGQAFWEWARVGDAVPVVLQQLADRDRVPVGPDGARQVLAYLHALGMRDDETPNLRTPVEVVDYDGQPVAV